MTELGKNNCSRSQHKVRGTVHFIRPSILTMFQRARPIGRHPTAQVASSSMRIRCARWLSMLSSPDSNDLARSQSHDPPCTDLRGRRDPGVLVNTQRPTHVRMDACVRAASHSTWVMPCRCLSSVCTLHQKVDEGFILSGRLEVHLQVCQPPLQLPDRLFRLQRNRAPKQSERCQLPMTITAVGNTVSSKQLKGGWVGQL